MGKQKGITLVELVVILCIAGLFVAITVPKLIASSTKEKMWDGMSTLMTYESAQLAYIAQNGGPGPADSLTFRVDSSAFFSFSHTGDGCLTATAKVEIGRFGKGGRLHTCIDTAGGVPRIIRSCSPGDTPAVKRYIPAYFN